MSKLAKNIMRAYLELDDQGRQEFRQLLGDFETGMKCADLLPPAHPDKASRRWKALDQFKKRLDQ
jgi:hypothetical protein